MSMELEGTVEGDFARELISELLADECDDNDFVGAVADAYRTNPDAPWEVLALIDRYHRLGQLPTERFRAIKSRIEQLAMGARQAAAAPQPQPEEAAEHTQELHVRGRAASRPGSTTPARLAAPQHSLSAQYGSPPQHAHSSEQTVPPPASASPQFPAVPPPQAMSAAAPPPPAPAAPRSAAFTREPVSAPERPATAWADRQWTASPRVGEVLCGRYELQSALGSGGMGTVYRALDRGRAALGLDQAYVAVKVLHEEHTRRPELVAAFVREFEFTQGLSHPNVVNVHEIHQRGEMVFFAMELLLGAHLNQIIARTSGRPLPRPQILAIVRDVGAALIHAHARGVVHGDLKPQNIMITDDGDVRVLDFGAACQVTHEPWISEFTPGDFRAATPAYASCEVMEGARPEPADDLYALACVTYVLLAGEHPFGGRTAKEARLLKLRPRRPKGLRASAWAALSQALSWQRVRRAVDIGQWLEQIDLREAAPRLPPQSLLLPDPPAQGRWLVAAAVLTAIVAAGALIGALMPRDTRATLAAMADQTAGGAALDLRRLRERIGANPSGTDAAVAAPLPSHGAGDAGAAHSTPALVPAGSAGATAPASPVSFASDVYTVGANEAAARIIIHRTGAPGRALDFVWWTEAASAKPGEDYASLGRRHEHMAPGQDTLTVFVPIVAGGHRRDSASFYVAMNAAGAAGGQAPEQRAAVVVERKKT
jgi:hypothetical protein